MAASASSVTWLVILSLLVAGTAANPRRDLKGVAAMDDTLSVLSTECDAKKDSLSCVKYKVLTVIEQLFRKESFKVSEGVTVVKNGAEPAVTEESSGRSSGSLVDAAMELVTGHDLRVQLPGDATLEVSPRALDSAGEIKASLRFDNEGRSVEEARKSKLKKIIVPVLVFVLLKAITLVPLLVGALGLKAWNALQLSFFSFVISVALAIFQLCKKLASDSAVWPATATVSAHAPWEPSGAGHQVAWGRADDDAQRLAYRGYAED